MIQTGTSRLLADKPYGPILKSLKGSGSSYEMKQVVFSVLKLQRWWRDISLKQRTKSAVIIQSHIRGLITRRKASRPSPCGSQRPGVDFKYMVCSVLKLQRWWRHKSIELRRKSAVRIQSCVRGWITRRKFNRKSHQIVVIQVRLYYSICAE